MEINGPDGMRSITGDDIDATLAPDGQRLTHVLVPGAVVVHVAATATTPTRDIQASKFEGTGTDATGLTLADFAGVAGGPQVTMHEFLPATKTAAAIDRTAQAKASIRLELGGDLGTVNAVRFNGGFNFSTPDVTAHADQGRYVEASGLLSLAPVDNSPDPPYVTVRRMKVFAPGRLEVNTVTNNLDASGAGGVFVTGNLMPADDKDPKTKPSAAPALFDDKKPIIFSAQSLHYIDATGWAELAGTPANRVQLLQDSNTLYAETAKMNNNTGDLTAAVNVVSHVLFDDTQPAQTAKGTTPVSKCPAGVTCVTAHDLAFVGQGRVATYKGTAVLDDPNGMHIEADTVTLTLQPQARSLLEARAVGHLSAKLVSPGEEDTVEGSATGELTYAPDVDHFHITGNPVDHLERTIDSKGDSCTTTKGDVIDLWRPNDKTGQAENKWNVAWSDGRLTHTEPMVCPPKVKK